METLTLGMKVTIYMKGIGTKTGIIVDPEGMELETHCTYLLKTPRGNHWSFKRNEVRCIF